MSLAEQLFLLAFMSEGFSVECFARTYKWIMFGLILEGGALYRKELQVPDTLPASVLAVG